MPPLGDCLYSIFEILSLHEQPANDAALKQRKSVFIKVFRVECQARKIAKLLIFNTIPRSVKSWNDTTGLWQTWSDSMISTIRRTGMYALQYSRTFTTARYTVLRTCAHLCCCLIGESQTSHFSLQCLQEKALQLPNNGMEFYLNHSNLCNVLALASRTVNNTTNRIYQNFDQLVCKG